MPSATGLESLTKKGGWMIVAKKIHILVDESSLNEGKSAKGKKGKPGRWRNPASPKKEMTANEATLRAWKKTYENRCRKAQAG